MLAPIEKEERKQRSYLALIHRAWLHAKFKPCVLPMFSFPGAQVVRTVHGLKFGFLSALDEPAH